MTTPKYVIKDQHPCLKVKLSKGKGRGIFATEEIKKGAVFLEDPIIFVQPNEVENYVFEENGKVFICLGYSSLFNHSSNPNCYWSVNLDPVFPTIKFMAYKKIKIGEEIKHSYNWTDYPDGFDY